MKKNVVRIISAFLLLFLMFQTMCFADLIGPGGPNPVTHRSSEKKESETIEISISKLIFLIFLCIIAFISLFVVVYYLLSKYSNKNINAYANNMEITQNNESTEEGIKE